jgi:hypothetical protein
MDSRNLASTELLVLGDNILKTTRKNISKIASFLLCEDCKVHEIQCPEIVDGSVKNISSHAAYCSVVTGVYTTTVLRRNAVWASNWASPATLTSRYLNPERADDDS